MITIKKSLFYAIALYGATFMLFCSCEKEKEKNVPALTTIEVTEINKTNAISGGNITDDGNTIISARGVCWSINQNPTINDNRTEDGMGVGSFISYISGLEPNTAYYVRAYATNNIGTGYGSNMYFTTLDAAILPHITTCDITNITPTTAESGGDIADDGGAAVIARGVCWSANLSPTINDSKTIDGTGVGSFTSRIRDLEPNTTYYLRAYATNSKGTSYGVQYSFETTVNSIIYGDGVTDIDGNEYITVIIGEQEWMAENLKTTKYSDGTDIPNVTDNSSWAGLNSDAYCWYNNDEAFFKNSYGALYNWYTVNTSKICPTGWRVPTDEEWSTLTSFAGGPGVSGKRLKSTHTVPDAHPCWNGPYTGATDEFGFSAFPGGSRDIYASTFNSFFDYGYWWSSTQKEERTAWARAMSWGSDDVYHFDTNKGIGFSVRCVRGN